MATSALEEKINKIRLQNEEIRRRHEEVEADKKHAAKLNALVQMVPSDNWPERKEPPEFSTPPKNSQKQKILNKEYSERTPQHYSGIQERLAKKEHKFAQGDGPPPDPKYNFLADSEREMRMADDSKADDDKNKIRNKTTRGAPKRRGVGSGGSGGSRDAYFKDNRGPQAFHSKEESLPEYEAWRAERNRIDEARINRQKTAEGNWRREWDNDKTNVEKDSSKKGDSVRKDLGNFERRNNHYDTDYSNRGYAGNRNYHGSQKNHSHQDYRRQYQDQSHEYKKQSDNKPPLSPTDDRTVTSTDKSIKITVNHGNQAKGTMMSVKVNSPSIAGTGRVGPRQKSRVTYSSQSETDQITHELNNFSRQKSFDDKITGTYFNNSPKSTPKSPFLQRKKESHLKSPFSQKKEFKTEESSVRSKNLSKTHCQKNEFKDQRISKVQEVQKRDKKSAEDKIKNFSASDEAIPSEYNPDKSFIYKEVVKNTSVLVENSFEDANNKYDNIVNEPNHVNNEPVNEDSNLCHLERNIDNENLESNDSFENSSDNVNEIINESMESYVSKTNGTDNESVEIEEMLENIKKNREIIEKNTIAIKDNTIKLDETISSIQECSKNTEKSIQENTENVKETNTLIKNPTEHIQSTTEIIKDITTNITEDTTKNINEVIQNKEYNIKGEKSFENINITSENDFNTNVEKPAENSKEIIENIEAVEITKESNENKVKTIESVKNQDLEEIIVSKTTEENDLNEIHLKNSKKEILNNEEFEMCEEPQKSESQRNNDVKVTFDNEIDIDVKTDSQSTKFSENSKQESIISDGNRNLKLDMSQNESFNDSGFVDNSINVSIESDKQKITEIDNIQNISIAKNNFVDDSDKIRNNLEIEPNQLHVENNVLEIKNTDLVDETKENVEKAIEICDTDNTNSGEISQSVEKCLKIIEKNCEQVITLDNSTKDVDVINDIHESLEYSKLNDGEILLKSNLEGIKNIVLEESMKVVSEESKKD